MKRSKLITMAISLLAAICLWAYVVTVVNPDGDTIISGIPVTFSGQEVLREDQQLVIKGDYTDMVSVHFYGKNTDLKKLEQYKDELSAVVDVSKVRSAKEYQLTYQLTLPNAVQASAVQDTDRNPSVITIQVEKLARREIEVQGDFTGVEVADGYLLESTSFDYDTVTVEGPESVVSTISCAQIVMSRTNVDKNITESVDYTLVDADGNEVDTTDLTTDVDTIEVELDVVKYKQVPLSVNFIDGGGATGADADVDIDPKSITLAGDATVLDSVNTIVLGNVDLGATDNNAVLSFDIKIPNDAKNVSGEESATVTIKIKNKRTKVIGATNIAFINTPDGFDARSITQLVQTTVRASNTEIDRIAANNLRVVADLSEYTQAGTYQVPVTIYIDGYPDAGVIGDDYKIVVVLEAVE